MNRVLPVPSTSKALPNSAAVKKAHTEDIAVETASHEDALIFTKKFAGGLRDDLKRRTPWYLSDWTEAMAGENRSQALASIIFLFFACISPAVTFGMWSPALDLALPLPIPTAMAHTLLRVTT